MSASIQSLLGEIGLSDAIARVKTDVISKHPVISFMKDVQQQHGLSEDVYLCANRTSAEELITFLCFTSTDPGPPELTSTLPIEDSSVEAQVYFRAKDWWMVRFRGMTFFAFADDTLAVLSLIYGPERWRVQKY